MTESAQEIKKEQKTADIVEKPVQTQVPAKKENITKKGKIAVVLVRGLVRVSRKVVDTLHMINLRRKNNCVFLDDTPINRGMLQKVKDYVTYGSVSDEFASELFTKKGNVWQGREEDRKKKYKYNFKEINGKKYHPTLNLSPPRKGFGRKGIKKPFSVGGALGKRGEKMQDLLLRMTSE